MTDWGCEASVCLDGTAADKEMTQPSSQLSLACLQKLDENAGTWWSEAEEQERLQDEREGLRVRAVTRASRYFTFRLPHSWM